MCKGNLIDSCLSGVLEVYQYATGIWSTLLQLYSHCPPISVIGSYLPSYLPSLVIMDANPPELGRYPNTSQQYNLNRYSVHVINWQQPIKPSSLRYFPDIAIYLYLLQRRCSFLLFPSLPWTLNDWKVPPNLIFIQSTLYFKCLHLRYLPTYLVGIS